MTCTHFGRDQIFLKQVDASFSPFGQPTQVKASRVTSIRCCSNLLANEIQDMCKPVALKCFFFSFATCVYLRGKLSFRLATLRKSLHKFNLRLLATACECVWPGLKKRRGGLCCNYGANQITRVFSSGFFSQKFCSVESCFI